MNKNKKHHFGKISVLTFALMQAGVVAAAPGMVLDTTTLPVAGNCSASYQLSSNSHCTVTVNGKAITVNGTLSADAGWQSLIINGDSSAVDTLYLSGSIVGDQGVSIADGFTLDVAAGTTIASNGRTANAISGNNFTLLNSGTIAVAPVVTSTDQSSATTGAGVRGSGFTLVNRAGGSISGGQGKYNTGFASGGGDGVNGISSTITNNGTITGGTGGAIAPVGLAAIASMGAAGSEGIINSFNGGAGLNAGAGANGNAGNSGGAGGNGAYITSSSLTNNHLIHGGQAGVAQAGQAGGNSVGGAGGNGFSSWNGNGGRGGNGGAAGAGGSGGNGGRGGTGILTYHSQVTNSLGGQIIGGAGSNGAAGGMGGNSVGGNGGNGYYGGHGGNGGLSGAGGNGGHGGAGGTGLSGHSMTVINLGEIRGGNGGAGGAGGSAGASMAGAGGTGYYIGDGGMSGSAGTVAPNGTSGMAGVGGAGVEGMGNSTVRNAGTIAGGTGLNGQADAIRFYIGGNKLILEAGSVIEGNVVADAGDTLALGGSNNAQGGNTFDLSDIGTNAQYRGFGRFEKEGTSTWTLTGNGIGSGGATWNVRQGTLALADNVSLAGRVSVDTGATLHAQSASVQFIDNAGRLTIDAGKTLTANEVVFTATSIFSPVVTNTSYGRLMANSVQLDGALAVDASTMTNAYTPGNPLVIIQATTLSGDFASYSDNSLLFNFTPVKNGNNVELTVASATTNGVSSAVSTQGNTFAAGTAAALDSIIASNPTGEIANAFMAVSTNQNEIANAVSKTAPLLAGSVTNTTFNTLGTLNGIVQSRQSGQSGKSSGDTFYGDKAFWFKPYGSWADQGARSGAPGYDSKSYGMIFGADASLSDVNRVGAAFAYAKTDVDGKGVATQNAKIDSYTFAAYGTHRISESTELQGQADMGVHDTDGSRLLNFGGLNTRATSSYKTWSGHVGASLNHAITLSAKTVFTPSVRADYTYLRSKAYSENGAGAFNLNVAKTTTDAFVIGVDGKVSHAISNTASFVGNLGVGYDLINDRASMTSSFAGAPTVVFATQGIAPSPWLVRGGFGLTGKISDTMEITARYDIESRTSFNNQTASVKFRWMF